MKKIDYQKQGKRNLASGRRFELLVRKDLESKGWIVSRWGNNIEDVNGYIDKEVNGLKIQEVIPRYEKKCIPSKQGRFRKTSTGFPDFICYKKDNHINKKDNNGKKEFLFEIIFVECKSKGYLSKEEKEKASWYLENNYCSKFLIASKTKDGRKIKIEYKEFLN